MSLYSLNEITVTLKPKKAPKITIFEKFSLAIEAGEFLCIEGPSGSGKSTLLNVLEGYLKPSEGSASFRGNSIYSLSDHDLMEYRNQSIGMVFQFFNLIPYMSALDNVAIPALIKGVPRKAAHTAAHTCLRAVGLESKFKNRAFELSGGEQQRVAVARALINEPDVILADEPTGNLDRKSSDGLCELFQMINDTRKTTLVLVTHDSDVASIAKRRIKVGG
jgi:ABC-type lipoprotein export system ATPase subunit